MSGAKKLKLVLELMESYDNAHNETHITDKIAMLENLAARCSTIMDTRLKSDALYKIAFHLFCNATGDKEAIFDEMGAQYETK